ncbi:MAG: sodium:calcium antiporter [Acidobacteria bacterium]|nr:sodium:calcium antiporter [Acidobacteriota bacterium]
MQARTGGVARAMLWLALAVAGALPALVLRVLGAHPDEAAGAIAWRGGELPAALASLVFGLAVLAGAFLVSWSAELLQFDVSRNLATALIALLAVLPEYTVDIYLAWTAATVPENAPLALANMTGANRLLIGIGWPLISIAWWMTRGRKLIRLERSRWGEVFFLAAATLYSFVIPIKGQLNLFDSAILLAIFVMYIRYAVRQDVVEPELAGPPEVIGLLPVWPRRAVTLLMFLFAGATLFAAAEPFAEGLKLTGRDWGVSEFLLIQWLAPLASESPEFIIVMVFALQGKAATGFGTLLSSKVNQWTLLVSMVPIAYGLGLVVHGQHLAAMPLDARQLGEVLLTSAQSFFAVMIVLNRRFELKEAIWLLTLFLAQFGLSIAIEEGVDPARHDALFAIEKSIFSVAYIVLGTIELVRYRRSIRPLARMVWSAETRTAE